MYQATKRTISNKAYAVVKKWYKKKFNRKAYRQEMKKKFKITSRDADQLRIDYGHGKITALFKSAYGAKTKLTIYCCKDGEVVYEPVSKDFSVDVEGKAEWITRAEWKRVVMKEIIPTFVMLEGEVKCKAMSGSLKVCPDYDDGNPVFTKRGIPFKVKKGGKK